MGSGAGHGGSRCIRFVASHRKWDPSVFLKYKNYASFILLFCERNGSPSFVEDAF